MAVGKRFIVKIDVKIFGRNSAKRTVRRCVTRTYLYLFGSFPKTVRNFLSSLLDQFAQNSAVVGEKSVRMVKLRQAPVLHHQNLVAVHDGVQPVRYGQHRAPAELPPDGTLDQLVGLRVHVGCSFVQNENLVHPDHRSGQAQELSLSHAEIHSSF
jgi:hypothetical protein